MKKILSLTLFIILSCSQNEGSIEIQNEDPTVLTTIISDITETSAIVSGNITNDGGNNITSRGICWDTSSSPTLNNNFTENGYGIGDFSGSLINLNANIIYYARAYATNSLGTTYGIEKEFTTLSPSFDLPIVLTFDTQNIESNSAGLSGGISSDGGTNIIERGFCYSTTPDPNINNDIIKVDGGIGYFNTTLTELDRNTTYYVKAYATNSLGTTYGTEKEFTTLDSYYLFSAENISREVLHNLNDKIIYFFTYTNSYASPMNRKIVAYSYETMEIVAEKNIDFFVEKIHSVGIYNNEIELYVSTNEAVTILNGKTLETKEIIDIPEASYGVSCIQSKNNLIFASFPNIDLGKSEIYIYNRNDLSLVNKLSQNIPNSGAISLYEETSNNLRCIIFPQFSNSPGFHDYTLDSEGNVLQRQTWDNYDGDNNKIRTNDNSHFILKGTSGRVYLKNDFSNNSYNLSDGTIFNDLTDYIISTDGMYIYAIRNALDTTSYNIQKFNSTNFTVEELIPTQEIGRNLFLDGNKLIIINYDVYNTEKEIFMSFYEK